MSDILKKFNITEQLIADLKSVPNCEPFDELLFILMVENDLDVSLIEAGDIATVVYPTKNHILDPNSIKYFWLQNKRKKKHYGAV